MAEFPITYIPGVFSEKSSDALFKNLWEELDWERREFAPRREYWTNTFDRPYTYGRGEFARTYFPKERTLAIRLVDNDLYHKIGEDLEGCFINGYENDRDHLGWHADDDLGIDHTRPIVIVTLYGPKIDNMSSQDRSIELMNKATGEKLLRPLAHGSVLLMHAGMQDTHLHRIPKAGFISRPRISLTFRGLVQ